MADSREQINYFLDMESAKGEAQTSGFSEQVKVLSWNFGGQSQSTVGRTSGSGAGQVEMSAVTVVTEMDAATTKLASYLTQGKHLDTATLTATKSGSSNGAYITVKLTEVFVSRLNVQASGQVPIVNITLTYKSISTVYKKQSEQGTLVTAGTFSYDASTNVTS